jgi:hypothetical protein
MAKEGRVFPGLWRAWVVLLCVAMALLFAACGSDHATATGSSGASSGGATVVSPSADDLSGMVAAWKQFNEANAAATTCTVGVTPGSVKEAYVASTKTWWAIATIEPTSPCSIGGNGFDRFFSANDLTGVFEKQAGVSAPALCRCANRNAPDLSTGWVMNSQKSVPFPCSPTIGVPSGAPGNKSPGTTVVTPGPGLPTLPLDVLNAWNLNPAPSCTTQGVWHQGPPR